MKEVVFEREKIASRVIIPGSIDFTIAKDIATQDLNCSLEVFIATRRYDTKKIRYTFPRPTFREWFFRREREVKVNVTARDALLDPPAIEDRTIRLYEFDPIYPNK